MFEINLAIYVSNILFQIKYYMKSTPIDHVYSKYLVYVWYDMYDIAIGFCKNTAMLSTLSTSIKI